MRAKEFTINVPINIKINGDGDPEIDVAGNDSDDEETQDVMLSPQQQELELQKTALGKSSKAAEQILADPEDNQIA